MTRCELYCPVCRQPFDWLRGYGRDIRCCCKSCHDEAEWRRTLAIMGKAYYPQSAVCTNDCGDGTTVYDDRPRLETLP
jgi:hypothetical protein